MYAGKKILENDKKHDMIWITNNFYWEEITRKNGPEQFPLPEKQLKIGWLKCFPIDVNCRKNLEDEWNIQIV